MDSALYFEVHLQLLAVGRHVIFDLRLSLLDFLVRYRLAPPDCKQKDQVFYHLGEIKRPLNIALE